MVKTKERLAQLEDRLNEKFADLKKDLELIHQKLGWLESVISPIKDDCKINSSPSSLDHEKQ